MISIYLSLLVSKRCIPFDYGFLNNDYHISTTELQNSIQNIEILAKINGVRFNLRNSLCSVSSIVVLLFVCLEILGIFNLQLDMQLIEIGLNYKTKEKYFK